MVVSTANNTTGVNGVALGSSGETYGVRGQTFSNTPNATGVKGEASAGVTNAVWGQNFSTAENATGVFGLANAEVGNTIGVLGRSNSSSNNAYGVYGQASGGGIGVRGDSPSGTAIVAASNTGRGVVAQTTSGNALVGITAANNVAALLAQNIGGLGRPVRQQRLHQGSYTATGDQVGGRQAARRHPRADVLPGIPEPWFEDFGTAELRNGQASVALDPEFDEVVKGDDYRVFLTEIGDCGGLYVSRKGPHRFEVRSRGGAGAAAPSTTGGGEAGRRRQAPGEGRRPGGRHDGRRHRRPRRGT